VLHDAGFVSLDELMCVLLLYELIMVDVTTDGRAPWHPYTLEVSNGM
jgi:hypothetical protein